MSISINEYTPPDAEPPATMLKAQPGEPDGVDGWYRNAPTVVLTSSERGETWYRWGSNGDFTEVPEDDDITAPEGTNTLYFYSVDEANNAEDPKTHEFKVDTVDPSTTTLSAEVISAGVVRLTWPAATDSGSGVYDYAVTKGDVVIAATTETNMDVDQLAADAVTTLRVVASDKAGNTSSSEGLNVTTQKLTEVATNATGLQEVGVTFERAWKPGKLNTNKLSRLQAPPPEGWTWDIPGKNGGRWRGAAWDVSTDVIFDSSSGFTITLAYDGNVLSREQELQLGLFHYEETSPGVWQWVQVPASVDTGPNLIRGVGHSFSDWAVFGPAGMVGEEDNGGGGPVVSTPASSVWSLGLLGFVGLALAALTRRRRFARR